MEIAGISGMSGRCGSCLCTSCKKGINGDNSCSDIVFESKCVRCDSPTMQCESFKQLGDNTSEDTIQ